MWTAFPPPDYYGSSAPPQALSGRRAFPPAPPGRRRGPGASGWFPRSPQNRSTGEVPSSAPATSPRLRRRLSPWPPGRRRITGLGVPRPRCGRVRAAIQPLSTGFELADYRLRGVMPLVPRVHLPVLLAGPAPSGRPGASRRCRGCLPPSPASPGSGCPQLPHAAATTSGRRSLTPTRFRSASWRSASAAHSPIAVRDRAPASTAAAATASMLTSACRRPLRSRGSGTTARRSSRPGHSPSPSGAALQSWVRTGGIGDDGSAGTVFRRGHEALRTA
jgi:hypothetical protein